MVACILITSLAKRGVGNTTDIQSQDTKVTKDKTDQEVYSFKAGKTHKVTC